MKRVVITPDLLIEIFGKKDLDIMLLILAPFACNEADAKKAFSANIERLKAAPKSPGGKMAIDAFKQLKRAYEKMTIFERENVRKKLPEKLSEFLLTKYGAGTRNKEGK